MTHTYESLVAEMIGVESSIQEAMDRAQKITRTLAALASPSPEPLDEDACGVMGLCELPKGHEGQHSTSVDRAIHARPRRGGMSELGAVVDALRDFVALLPADRWDLLRPETVATVDRVLNNVHLRPGVREAHRQGALAAHARKRAATTPDTEEK